MGRYEKLPRWPLAACDEPRAFICERPPWTVFPATGHAYAVLQPADGLNAAAACATVGAHLATITSAEENRFLAAMVNVEVGLGANNTGPDAPYRWITGEPVAYQAFAPGEADQKQPARCVALDSDDLWHDRYCHPKYAVLCEID